nr:unnamed protein product [Callosobruchus chinensis]
MKLDRIIPYFNQYHAERDEKIEASKRSGAGTHDIYKAHLWYYDLLLFYEDSEPPRASVNNIEDEGSEQKGVQENDDEGERSITVHEVI